MIHVENLMPLVQVSRSLKKSPSTVWRWLKNGVKVRDRRVRLRAIRVGGNYFISPDDLKQFFLETNETPVEGSVESALRRVEQAGI